MYKIVGADGKEYGPVSAQILRQWIAENRLHGQMKVLAEGETEWKTIEEIPELASALPVGDPARVPVAAPPPRPISARDLVKGPGVGLIVTGAVNIVLALACIILSLAGVGKRWRSGMHPPQNEVTKVLASAVSGGHEIRDAIGVVSGVVTLFGGLLIRKLEKFAFCVAACFLAMFPCTSPCCPLGLAVGMWALVIICKPEVKARFH